MTLTTEHKFEIDKMKRELNSLKAKYLAQKRKNQTLSAAEQRQQPAKENLPTIQPADSHKMFLGGGFNFSPPVGKICHSPLVPINT